MFGHTHKSRPKKNNNNTKRLLETRDEKTEAYLLVIKALGNCSFQCENKNTGKEVFSKTANRLTKGPHKKFIKVDDIVLAEVIRISVNKEEYMIKHVYTPEEAKALANMGELTNFNINNDNNNSTVVFEKDQVQTIDMDEEINFDDI